VEGWRSVEDLIGWGSGTRHGGAAVVSPGRAGSDLGHPAGARGYLAQPDGLTRSGQVWSGLVATDPFSLI
jgi:hypothetical protein